MNRLHLSKYSGLRRKSDNLRYLHNYYIRTTGDDSTGNGSSASPWKTFTKAFTVAGDGDRILVGDGVYSENTSSSGYWSIAKNLTNWLTIEPENGLLGNVTVKATSGTVQNTLFSGTSAYLRFKWIKFGALAGTRYNIRFNAAAHHIDFQSCTFQHAGFNYENIYHAASAVVTSITFSNCTISSTGTLSCVLLNPGGGNACDFTFTNCTITSGAYMTLRVLAPATVTVVGGTLQTTGGSNSVIYVTGGATLNVSGATLTSASGQVVYSTNVANTVNLTNVTVNSSVASDALSLNGGTITLTDLTVNQTGNAKAITFGLDGDAGGLATNFSLSNVHVHYSGTVHAVLVGNGATGTITGLNVTAPTGDYALVVKENTGVNVQSSYLESGSIAALYFKGATNPIAQHNQLVGDAGVCFLLSIGDTGHTTSGATLTENTMQAGAHNIFDWNTTGDGGGNVCDYNHYDLLGAGNFGDVLAAVNIGTLADLRTAWAAYGDGSNDSHSTAA